jgi:hypothetical protein
LPLSERLLLGSVMSGRSVWLSVDGGLTLFAVVDPKGSDWLSLCRPSPTEDRRRDLIDGMCSGAVRVGR